MIRAYKYRIYPNKAQSEMIDKTIGVCRLVYNLALETKLYVYKSHGKKLTAFDLCYQLVELKQEYPWIAEVDSQAVQASVKRLDKSFQNFFRGGGFPKFKKKSAGGSFQCPNNVKKVDWSLSTLSIPKIKNIPIKLSRRFDGDIKTITISKTPTGKHFASILVETAEEKAATKPLNPGATIGVDVGIKSLAITSDGRVFEANRKLKDSLKRLQCLQRRASRKQKGSNNRKKANKCVAILHEKITNQRTDYIHKVTHALTHDNQVGSIIIEDLNVAGMLKNRKISQAISDVSMSEFYRQLGYKCEWYGINLIKIGRFDPSSKRCSDCGEINQELTLADREWTCPCGSTHDRDFNAAKNIKWFGFNNSPAGSRGEPVESRRLRRASKQELKDNGDSQQS
jgi:putative transposase